MIRSPRRRLTAIAVMGALAVGALAGCRTDAGTAAYVGNTRITNDQVNAIVDSAPQLGADLTGARQEVVNDLVYLAAVQKYATANKIKLTPVDDATAGAVRAGIPDPERRRAPQVHRLRGVGRELDPGSAARRSRAAPRRMPT